MLCWCKSVLAVLIIIFVWLPGTVFNVLITIAAALILILSLTVGCCCKGSCCNGKCDHKEMKTMPEKVTKKKKR
ncbi:hypothetical protein C4573_03095 [Candidatus Woesearchaeota archaeon]|nr:MAG: hypothetical protein C4573_03095 [Candidatus Woesearchaeota archaeon]